MNGCFPCMYVYAPCVPGVLRGQKKEQDLLKLESRRDGSCYVGVGDQTLVFCKDKCF